MTPLLYNLLASLTDLSVTKVTDCSQSELADSKTKLNISPSRAGMPCCKTAPGNRGPRCRACCSLRAFLLKEWGIRRSSSASFRWSVIIGDTSIRISACNDGGSVATMLESPSSRDYVDQEYLCH